MHRLGWTLAGLTALGVARRAALRAEARTQALADALLAGPSTGEVFSPSARAGLPEPARRYLGHALAPGTPLAPAVRLTMRGTLVPRPGAAPVALVATETLAPRTGFVWSARARLRRLPVRVTDHYAHGRGGVAVRALGLVPLPTPTGADVARSSRDRLVAEAVWCPTALAGPDVAWTAVDAERATYALAVDGVTVAVTIRVAPDGALREVTMQRWGDADGLPWRRIPYGFRVDAEATLGGVTVPTRLAGGWHYGTERFDPAAASAFEVQHAAFAPAPG